MHPQLSLQQPAFTIDNNPVGTSFNDRILNLYTIYQLLLLILLRLRLL